MVVLVATASCGAGVGVDVEGRQRRGINDVFVSKAGAVRRKGWQTRVAAAVILRGLNANDDGDDDDDDVGGGGASNATPTFVVVLAASR